MWHTKLISRHLGPVAILKHSQLSQRLSVRLTRFSDGHGLAVLVLQCGDALAMLPTLLCGKPCNVANPTYNVANPAMWPTLQCGKSCNVANLAMWQTLQCGQFYIRCGQPCNVANPACNVANPELWPTLQCGQPCNAVNPAMLPTLQCGKPCNVANPTCNGTNHAIWTKMQRGQRRNAANPAMWPTLQCGQPCNVANPTCNGTNHAMWTLDNDAMQPTLQRGQSSHAYGQSGNCSNGNVAAQICGVGPYRFHSNIPNHKSNHSEMIRKWTYCMTKQESQALARAQARARVRTRGQIFPPKMASLETLLQNLPSYTMICSDAQFHENSSMHGGIIYIHTKSGYYIQKPHFCTTCGTILMCCRVSGPLRPCFAV